MWNKTPEKLVLDLWPRICRMAKETGSKMVPVIHYLADPHKKYEGNVIHTVVADPVSMEGLSETESLELLRDTMATLRWDLMHNQPTLHRADITPEQLQKEMYRVIDDYPPLDWEYESTCIYRPCPSTEEVFFHLN